MKIRSTVKVLITLNLLLLSLPFSSFANSTQIDPSKMIPEGGQTSGGGGNGLPSFIVSGADSYINCVTFTAKCTGEPICSGKLDSSNQASSLLEFCQSFSPLPAGSN